MRMETSLHHRMEQQLRLAPQIIQSIEILQLQALDLQDLVKQELMENEVLEEANGKLRTALTDLLADYDEERAAIDVTPDPGCQVCTDGCTPYRLETGPCHYHRAHRALETTGGVS